MIEKEDMEAKIVISVMCLAWGFQLVDGKQFLSEVLSANFFFLLLPLHNHSLYSDYYRVFLWFFFNIGGGEGGGTGGRKVSGCGREGWGSENPTGYPAEGCSLDSVPQNIRRNDTLTALDWPSL